MVEDTGTYLTAIVLLLAAYACYGLSENYSKEIAKLKADATRDKKLLTAKKIATEVVALGLVGSGVVLLMP